MFVDGVLIGRWGGPDSANLGRKGRKIAEILRHAKGACLRMTGLIGHARAVESASKVVGSGND